MTLHTIWLNASQKKVEECPAFNYLVQWVQQKLENGEGFTDGNLVILYLDPILAEALFKNLYCTQRVKEILESKLTGFNVETAEWSKQYYEGLYHYGGVIKLKY